jgi:Lrp/AsnC family transcriptional regulator of ectoine degradation
MERLFLGKLRQPPLRPSERNTRMKKLGLDTTDIRILSAVQQHGQLSKTKLAEIVNLSPTPCWARLDRLKAVGYIRGYHAELALERIVDFTQVVVTVSLGSHRKAEFDRFEGYIRNLDEVTDCIATGGGVDYVMKTATPSLFAFQVLMDDMLSSDLAIDRYTIYIATRQVKTSQLNLTKLITKSEK